MRTALVVVAVLATFVSMGCDRASSFLDALADQTEEPPPPLAPAAEEPEAPLLERPTDSVARTETEVITFGSILENREMSRAEKVRAFENLDPGALQKQVAQPNVTGVPPSQPVRRAASQRGPTDGQVKAARSRVPVVMYATSWCGVCKRARKYFEDQHISFVEYDVDKNVQARNEYLLLNPRRSVPTIKVGREVVVGFSPAAIENALDTAARAKL